MAENKTLNGYDLSRKWFDFCFENPDKVKPVQTALYFFIIEHCNRLGWKEKFGLPTTMAKEAIGIHSYNTYIKTLNELIDFGFIKMIQKSKNQYSSNIVAISNFNKALNKALDKALIKHDTKQSESTVQSTDSIIKQLTKEQLNNKQITSLKRIIKKYDDKSFNFKKSLLNLGIEENIVNDWLEVRKNKKASNTETAFDSVAKEIIKSKKDANECIKIAVQKSWSGFNHKWLDNIKDELNSSDDNHKGYRDINGNPVRLQL